MDYSPALTAFYLFIFLLPVQSHEDNNPGCRLRKFEPKFEYEYYKEGDVIVAGLISAHYKVIRFEIFDSSDNLFLFCSIVRYENYRSILSFIFAVDEINKDPDLLPNITLGYHIVDTCGDWMKTSHAVFNILSGYNKAPNYRNVNHSEVAAFVVDSNIDTMVPVLELYKYTQLNYGVGDYIKSNRDVYPTSFKLSPSDRTRYICIVTFLEYIGCNWVALITSGEESDEMEARELSKLMAEHEICVMDTIDLKHEEKAMKQMSELCNSTVEVLVVCGPNSADYSFVLSDYAAFIENLTLIFHESWINMIAPRFYRLFNGSFVFRVRSRTIPKVMEALRGVTPSTRPYDPLMEEIWFFFFNCLTKDQEKNTFYQWIYQCGGKNCTETYNISSKEFEVTDTRSYYAYVSVYILAQALHMIKVTGNKSSLHNTQKLHKFVKLVHYTDPNGRTIYFDDGGDIQHRWYIENVITYAENESHRLRPGFIFKRSSQGKLHIHQINPITWRNDRLMDCTLSLSVTAVTNWLSGQSINQVVTSALQVILEPRDSESCYKCPEEEWPDEKKEKCVPKTYEFLSYEKDIMVHLFLVLTLVFSGITLFTLGSFISYWDTPIVKANNRTVSFIILVSILLSFLSVFFFLGRPVDITCMMRQVSFGIFFSIVVSSVLAKTITVCIAFKATKPGSVWLKWVSPKVSNSVVLVCSSVQVLICVIWLLVSPPYVEFDHHTYPGKIIIQCNEGSDIWFYSMLGYLGFLAAVSFVLAFMVRTLPDTFNEAKYITFSMLVFCSVWIAMIPAYLSTRGKYMVAVEVFAILTSCAGILGCIFFPKVFILLLKPNMNSKNFFMKKNKS
ncbi:vomeronasal type-2 receptor 26-like [Dendropsophus ebraccatus]|uniref:vomeronasal type-2 receptor 26-like n=1 Tax=Dendropsophus ebraccatus TaxID=150705 RepID=UPI0038322CF1